jgi:hypothetical protein
MDDWDGFNYIERALFDSHGVVLVLCPRAGAISGQNE